MPSKLYISTYTDIQHVHVKKASMGSIGVYVQNKLYNWWYSLHIRCTKLVGLAGITMICPFACTSNIHIGLLIRHQAKGLEIYSNHLRSISKTSPPALLLTMESSHILVSKVHQILQSWVKLLQDALLTIQVKEGCKEGEKRYFNMCLTRTQIAMVQV